MEPVDEMIDAINKIAAAAAWECHDVAYRAYRAAQSRADETSDPEDIRIADAFAEVAEYTLEAWHRAKSPARRLP